MKKKPKTTQQKKKSSRILFSRFPFVSIAIILAFIVEFLIVYGAFLVLHLAMNTIFPEAEGYLQWVAFIIQWIVTAITAVHIINRDMLPEAKIPWLFVVIILNVFGVAIYIVFSSNRPSRRQRAQYKLLREHTRKYAVGNVSKDEAVKQMGDWAAVSAALWKKNKTAVLYQNTKAEYFPVGEAFFVRFLEDLRSAKQYIFLEYFILEYGQMWTAILEILREKVKEGVEVRVLYDDIGSMGYVRAGYYKILQKEGIQCRKFNPFVPVVSNIHNNRDHRKIAVIDGKVGYTGGINLGDEYINVTHPFGHWKDTAVRLEGEAVRSFVLMFLRFYNFAGKQIENIAPYLPDRYESFENEGMVQIYGDGPSPLYEHHLGEDVYINVLNGAKRYVWIMTPYLIITYRMRAAILNAAERGVDVRIVTPHIPDKKLAYSITCSNYMALIKGGVNIYEYTPGFVHAKSFLADDEIGIVGTINLDYRSLVHHYEDAVFMHGTKANAQLKEDYEKTFEVCALQTEEDAKKSVVSRWLCEIAKVFAPLF